VNALVLEVDLESEGQMIEKKKIIALDDSLDKKQLLSSKQSIKLLEQMLDINKDIAQSLNDTVIRQEGYYQRLNRLTTASKTQKDKAYSTFSSAKTQYLGTKEKIINLEKQILDLEYKMAQLQDSIAKKVIVIYDKYLYKILIRKGDFVTAGTPLVEIKDVSRAKLVIFLDEEDLEEIAHKIVYLNDEKTEYKVNKVWRIADEQFISSYRAEIFIPSPKTFFSKLMKIEIK
jgi:multidrug efflux pump subunit AcrA (membrane-fusion protein)